MKMGFKGVFTSRTCFPDDNLFVWCFTFQSTAMVISFGALRSSQQQWSFRDVASILWDFYPTLGCQDTQNALRKYNHPTKPIRLTCMDGLT